MYKFKVSCHQLFQKIKHFFNKKYVIKPYNQPYLSHTEKIAERRAHAATANQFTKNFETTYFNRPFFDHMNIFGKKGVFATLIFALIIIIGFSLMFTIGIPSSYEYYGGTRLVIALSQTVTADSAYETIVNFLPGS